MTIRRWTALTVPALAVVLLAVACGGGGGSGAGSGGTAKAQGSNGGGGSRYGYGGGGGGSSSGGGSTGSSSQGGGKAALTLEQTASYTFNPTNVKVNSGSTIEVLNTAGQIPHTFTVQGQNIDITNQGGQSQNVKISLKPGTYQFFCKFHGSPGQGMHGTLVVT
jgi:plastocyanin